MKCLKVEFLLCIFSLIFCEQSRSQVCKAGDIFSNYTDIKPDTLINFSCINHYSIENYYFDVNRDLQNDFRITAACNVALGAQSQFIDIYCLNSNSYVSLGHIDSAYHTYFATWMTAKVAKPYYRGDTINSYNTVWDSTALYLYYSARRNEPTHRHSRYIPSRVNIVRLRTDHKIAIKKIIIY